MYQFVRTTIIAIVVFALAWLFGHGCNHIAWHESGHASYVTNGSCIVNNTVPYEEYSKLLEWCDSQYTKR